MISFFLPSHTLFQWACKVACCLTGRGSVMVTRKLEEKTLMVLQSVIYYITILEYLGEVFYNLCNTPPESPLKCWYLCSRIIYSTDFLNYSTRFAWHNSVHGKVSNPQYNQFFFFVFINLFIYLSLAALGLCCCVQTFSSCSEWGLLFVAVHRLLLWWLLLLQSTGSRHAGFSSCSTWAQ